MFGQKGEFIIGIRAYKGSEAAIKEWQPTIDYLNKEITQYHFTLKPLVEYERIIDQVKHKKIDFLVCDPVMYVELQDFYGATRLATLQKKRGEIYFNKFGSVLFTRADREDLNRLSGLKGKTFMGVSPHAFAGFRVMQGEFKEQSIDTTRFFKKILYTGGRGDEVIKQVLAGKADVGTVRTGLIEEMISKNVIKASDTKILFEKKEALFPYKTSSRLYPEFPFVRLSHTSDDVAKQVFIALLSIKEDSDAALKGGYARWILPNEYSDVADLMKKLGVGIYKDYNKITFSKVMEKYGFFIVMTGIFILLLIALTLKLSRQSLRLEHKRKMIQNVLDFQDNMVIGSTRRELISANKAFFDFFGIESIEAFTKYHRCICEFFIEHEDFFHLGKLKEGENWLKAFADSSQEQIVSMLDRDSTPKAFAVKTGYFKESDVYIVSFTDITQFAEMSKTYEKKRTTMH